MSIPYRPLGILKDLLSEVGVEISYSYEDLIFIEDNHFLLQFGDVGKEVFFYHNRENKNDFPLQYEKLAKHARSHGIEFSYRGKYTITENNDGTISVAFLSP